MPASVSRRSVLQAGAGALIANVAVGASAELAPLKPTGKGSGKLVRPLQPLLLAHRGCSALRPEHTLASYAKAIADGADFVEPDLVVTRDGYLVARHENNIAETTDVATRSDFARRKTIRQVDGVSQEGWFTEDFTLAELQTLRARERLQGMREESHGYDGMFRVCTLGEIADFVAAEAAARGRVIGLIPEIKHSTYFNRIGLSPEPLLLKELTASRYLATAPVIVQSFEVGNLKALRPRLGDNVRLMQLVDAPEAAPADWQAAGGKRTYRDMVTPQGLAEVATYADWLAPNLRWYMPLGPDGHLSRPSGLVELAHAAGLLAGCWTFRPENRFLAADFRDGAGDGARNEAGSIAEMRRYLALGLDGYFTDDPRLGSLARASA